VTVDEGRRITITAIAREAGVSVPTVSRVLNGRSDVAPQTRERVEELLLRHGYRRRAARPRVSASLIDLVFNDLDSPWAVEIIRGVEDVAHAAGVGTVVSAIHRRTASTRQWLQNLRTRATDGVVLVASDLAPPVHAELRRLNVPMVLVDPAGVPTLDIPTIGATNWTGGLRATEHLISLGHRRIGFIAGSPSMLCSRARLDGYRAALEAAGLPLADELIQPGDFYHESGLEGARALLALEERPTAIFASSDQMAFGAYEAVRQAGLRVPDDVSVIGFDDIPDARHFLPPLSTVRQDFRALGERAVSKLLAVLGGAQPESHSLIAPELVVRASTARLAR
jgi:LacI family transcriptional regulator